MFNLIKTFFKSKIGLKDAGLFAYSMAICLKSGVSTVESVRLAGGKNTNKVKKSAQEIADFVEKGDTLFEAFNRQSSLWPQFFVNAIRCGEISGKLEEAFRSLARYAQDTFPVRENTRKIWFYPLVIITFGLVLQLGLFGFFLGLKSPYFISTFVSIVELAVLVLAIGLLSQSESVKMLFDKIKLQFPFFREFQIELSVNQFFSYLLLLYTSSIDVITSVEYAADTVENRAVRKNLYNAIPLLSRGETMHKSLSQSSYISPGFLEKIYVCELAGRLDEAFGDIAAKTDETSEQRMEVIQRTLFRILALVTGMSVVGTVYIIIGILGSSHK